jgi:hypothetical protein
LDLRVRLHKDDKLEEEDVSCDSAYMLEAMRRAAVYKTKRLKNGMEEAAPNGHVVEISNIFYLSKL